jgi:hypothetical protein
MFTSSKLLLLTRHRPLPLFFAYPMFGISTLEARRIMQIPDGVVYPSKQYTEEMLKKQYLKLAKVYHPDAQG